MPLVGISTGIDGGIEPSREWRHNGAMATIQIKNVPAATHAVWRKRAAAANQSLQEHLLAHLEELASRPTLDEALAELDTHSGGDLDPDVVVEMIRADRDRR